MEASTQHERLQAGRRALQDSGKTPRQVGQERTKLALRWIYDWGWSSPQVLEILANSNRNSVAARLARRGLINRTRTESGGGHRDVPAYILTLTKEGVEEVERWLTNPAHLLPYEVDPYRVNQSILRHDTIAQMATAKALRGDAIHSYRTERQLAQQSQAGVKQPDVLWLQHLDDKNRHLMAIEVELSAKWGRDLDQFIHGCVTSLTGDSARFHKIMLISDSPAIITRYKSAMKGGSEYDLWEKDARRYWVVADTTEVPHNIEGRFLCKLVERS